MKYDAKKQSMNSKVLSELYKHFRFFWDDVSEKECEEFLEERLPILEQHIQEGTFPKQYESADAILLGHLLRSKTYNPEDIYFQQKAFARAHQKYVESFFAEYESLLKTLLEVENKEQFQEYLKKTPVTQEETICCLKCMKKMTNNAIDLIDQKTKNREHEYEHENLSYMEKRVYLKMKEITKHGVDINALRKIKRRLNICMPFIEASYESSNQS